MADDALYWSTKLVLNFEDSSPTTFTDISPTPKTVNTVGGNAVNSATYYKTGTKSLALDGTGDYLHYADSADWQFGTGDFCVEFWLRPTAGSPGAENWLIQYGNTSLASGTDYGWVIRHQTTGKIRAAFYNSVTAYESTCTTSMTTGAWHHIAYTRTSGVVKLWINGVEEDSDTYVLSINVPPTSPRLFIGGATNSGAGLWTNGNIDGLRITKGYGRYTANFAASLPTDLFTATAAVTAAVAGTAPMATVSMTGNDFLEIAMPMATVAFTQGMRTDVSVPMPTVLASGHDATGENALEAVMPMPTADFRLGNNFSITAPMPTLSAGVTTTTMLEVAVSIPTPTVSMRITTTGGISIRATAPTPTVSSRASNRAVVVAPMATVAMRGTTGSVLTITATVPMPAAAMSVSSGGELNFALTLPMPVAGPWGRITAIAPMAVVEIIARSAVTVTYEAYAINLKHKPVPGQEPPADEVTRYTNFPFNQIVRYGNQYYGVADNGIYLLDGTTDATVPIPWAWKTALEDNDVPEKKTVRSAYFSGRIGPAATITVYAGESGSTPYTYTTPRDANPQNYRKVFGRGVKGRYYALGASGSGVLELDALDPEIDKMTRKI